MKIRAIRLRETGGFIQPKAVEDFSGGLDVLAGPNELGKSTLLRALQLALFEKHTTTKGVARSLTPVSGGSPLIEVDFETDAGLWRLRKQFFSGKTASLSDLGKGQIVARGAEAEEQARRLIDSTARGEAAPGVLWLGQTAALALVKPDEQQYSMLRRAIEAEVTDTAGDGRSRELLKLVALELGGLVTATGRKKTSGAYANAAKSRDALSGELDKVSSQLAGAEEQLVRLQDLTARAAQLSQIDAVEARRKALETAGAALAASGKNRSELVNAQTVLDKYVVEQAASAKALAEYKADLTAFAAIDDRLAGTKPKRKDLLVKIQKCESDVKAGAANAAAVQSGLAAAGMKLKERALSEARQAAREKLDEIVDRRARAQKSQDAVTSLGAQLDSFKVTPQLVDAARRESAEIAELEAQLGAGAPKVSIAYLKGVSGAIQIDGAPVADGAIFEPSTPLQLEVEGVGTITIEPGLGEDAVDLRADLEGHREQLTVLFATMGIADLDVAVARLNERDKLEKQLGEARAQLSALVPDGLDQLNEEVSRLTGLGVGDDAAQSGEIPASGQSFEDLQQAVEELEVARDKAAAIQSGTTQVLNDLRVELAVVESEVAHDGKELAALHDRLPPDKERADRRLALERADEARIQDVNLAKRNVEDLLGKTVPADQLVELERVFSLAERSKQTADDELASLREDIRELRGGLNVLAGEGLETRKVELGDQLAQACNIVETHERNIAALNLLRDELEQAGHATRARFLGPVLAHIKPYLSLVVPESDLEFGDNLEFAGLMREGASHSYEILSIGTREQIAVLVRLGFASLLAGSGAPVPLILDDALVYSDDKRIASAFNALKSAANLHQVIVLTCREAGFEALGGNRLKLVDWDVDATAA